MLKIIKRIVGCLVVIMGIIFTDRLLEYILVDDTQSEVRVVMHEFYQQENIDTLLIGSSLVYCGYDPRILDEVWGDNTYIAGTPIQKIDGSYYLLKEALKKNDIKTVYVDTYNRHYVDEPKERTKGHMELVYYITDYMKDGWNRFEFLINASGTEHYINSFFVPSRYGDNLLDLERMERIIKAKRREEYSAYALPDRFYKGAMFIQGQLGNPNLIAKVDEANFGPIKEQAISNYSLQCLDKMVELCKKEGIRLVLLGTPVPHLYIDSVEDYDNYHNYMKEYAKQNDIEFYNFNLCKIDYLNLEREDFLDMQHLSGVGNEKYSRFFADFMVKYTEEEKQRLFYNSVEEKNRDMEPQTFGITYRESEKNSNSYIFGTSANYDVDVEYRFCIIDNQNNELEIIQEFNKNNILFLGNEKGKKYKVTSRDIETKEVVEEVVVDL